MSRGKGLPALRGNTMHCEGTVGCTWKVGMSSGELIPANSLRPWALQQVHVSIEDLQEVHSFRSDLGNGEITFKTAKACSYRQIQNLPTTSPSKEKGGPPT